ncbi:M23 family metallopeptidase [Ensifer sp.]|jgi:hypothetical protein|uniref:M23 family metallopeptidase n=1 Tax=Ensifer sp. TaxID=1872086 RepID=UPI002E1388F2|nr:M23 family metallopeptidase [Ensifer sp.]
MIAIIGFLSALFVLLPLSFIWRLWRLDAPTRLTWLLVLSETAAVIGLILILGRWDVSGVWTRPGLAGLALAAAGVSLVRHRGRPWFAGDRGSLDARLATTALSLLIFGAALAYVVAGMGHHEGARALSFPLAGGRFVIAQGGGIAVLNHHSDHPAQRHALDITAVNGAGFRAAGLLPKDPSRYAIFGKAVVSPCEGTVIAAVDGFPDLSPPMTDRKNAAGNHVILSCDGIRVELAHLREGSIVAAIGARLVTGMPIGEVGNSGNSTEPHLHIHAVDDRSGAAVPITFDGRVPVRNAQFFR